MASAVSPKGLLARRVAAAADGGGCDKGAHVMLVLGARYCGANTEHQELAHWHVDARCHGCGAIETRIVMPTLWRGLRNEDLWRVFDAKPS